MGTKKHSDRLQRAFEALAMAWDRTAMAQLPQKPAVRSIEQMLESKFGPKKGCFAVQVDDKGRVRLEAHIRVVMCDIQSADIGAALLLSELDVELQTEADEGLRALFPTTDDFRRFFAICHLAAESSEAADERYERSKAWRYVFSPYHTEFEPNKMIAERELDYPGYLADAEVEVLIPPHDAPWMRDALIPFGAKWQLSA